MMGIPLSKLYYQRGIFHPPLHNLFNFKPTMFHLGDDYFCPTKILLSPEDNGDRLRTQGTIKVVEAIEKADGERFQNLCYILDIDNGKVEEIIYYSPLVDHLETTANEENKTNEDLNKLRELIGHQGPPMAPNPNWKKCKYNVLDEWETGEKTYDPFSFLTADDPVTCTSYDKGNGLSHIDCWERFKNLRKRDKHDLSCIASPKRGR